jgi:hypothetical protein
MLLVILAGKGLSKKDLMVVIWNFRPKVPEILSVE